MEGKKILVIDDEVSIQESLKGILEDEGFTALNVSTAEEGIAIIEEKDIDLVLLDIWLGDAMDGITALEEIQRLFAIPVIMISGHASIETAVQATRKGAYDFIEKPLSYDKVILSITNGLRFAQLEQENKLLREVTERKNQLTGNSESILALRSQIEMVAPTNAWVLIRGEHGTGKELVAQAIHSLSPSNSKPMVEVNCAAIPEELIESELFGHEKGSFTGANASKRGKFDQADGGILFLDEIGDMSLKTQAKTLRILQEQKFERVGGSKTINVNVRVLAATNKNLEEEIKKGTFRPDLFYRLNVVPIHVPLLRDRREDIPLLVEDLMETLNGKGLARKTFDESAYRELMKHDWPGNVRELRNFIERLAIMCPEQTISDTHIRRFLKTLDNQPAGQLPDNMRTPYLAVDFKEAKKAFEQQFLAVKLEENGGNISKTAELIGLERSHLHKKLKGLNIIE